jgi:hypothetical protein
VIDNFLNPELCPLFRKEIDYAQSQNLLLPNATHLVLKTIPNQTVFIEKKGIFEIDFVSKPLQSFQYFQTIETQRALLNSLEFSFPELQLTRQAIKGISYRDDPEC